MPFNDRRIVTLLFADVVGSTKAIADMDPDDAEEFLDNAIDLMVRGVHAYGGSVARIQGDGIMVIFGAPSIQEDHATRAVMAGLTMQENTKRRPDLGITIRVGIHSGPVIVRWQKNDFGRELDSVGSTVHQAAHIEARCPPGAVAISHVTRDLVKGTLDDAPLKTPDEGKGGGVPLFQVSSLVPETTLVPMFLGHHMSALVGRQDELDALSGVIEKVARGQGAALAVVGEAGFGKSRLALEAVQLAAKHALQVLEIRGSSIRSDTPFAPLRPFLAQVGIDATTLTGQQSETVLGDLGLSRSQWLGLRSLFGSMADENDWLEMPADERRKAIVSGAIRMVIEAVKARPGMLLVEDLHFMDTESRLFIDRLAKALKDHPAGIVLTTRPETAPLASKICGASISAGPLAPTEVRRLVANEFATLCEGAAQDDMTRISDDIVARAEGCPFAIEEFLRTTSTASDVSAFAIGQLPISLESLLRARLGGLAPDAQMAVEAASVLGPDAPVETVKVVADMGDEEFYAGIYRLIEERVVSITGDAAVRFSHQLLLEACYSGMVRRRRRSLHRRALKVLGEATSAHAVPHQEIARHAYACGELDAALEALWRACVAAIENAAIYSVVDLYHRALSLCDEIGDESAAMRAKFTLLVFDAFQQLGRQRELEAALESAMALFGDRQQTVALVQARLHLATMHWIVGHQRRAGDHLRACLEMPEVQGSLPLRSYAEFTLANVEYASGHPVAAVERLQKLVAVHVGELETARFGASISIPGVLTRAFSGWYMTDIGDYEEAERMLLRADELAEELRHGYSKMLASLGYGYWMYRTGDPRAVEQIRIGHDLCRSRSFFGLEPIGSGFLAAALLREDRLDEAAAVLQQSRDDGHSNRTGNAGNYYLMESDAVLAFKRGDLDGAFAGADAAVAFTKANGDLVHHAYALTARAELGLGSGKSQSQIAPDLEESATLADSMGMKPLLETIDGLHRSD